MNHKERYATSLKLAGALQKATQKKQMKPAKLNQQIMRYLSANSPIYYDDDPEAYIESGYEFNPDVYSVINGLTKAGASVPFIVHRVVDNKRAKQYYRYKSMLRAGATEKQVDRIINLKEEAFEEVDEDNELYKLLERPNPLQAFPEWYENTKGFQYLTGNAYTYMNRLSDGRIGEMWVMPSQWTKIKADGGSQELIKGYVVELYGHEGDDIEPENVMHWKYWNPDYDSPGSHLYGLSPLKSARRSLRLGNDAKTALSVSINNGGASGMMFPEDESVSSITPEQQSQIRNFLKRNQSPENFKSFLVFTQKMGYKQFGHPPVDLEIIEAGKLSQRDICNVYGFPSILLNDSDSSTYSNYVQARKQLYLDNVIPTLERDYAEMNRHLTPAFNDDQNTYHIDYDLQAIDAIQQDNSEKVDWLAKAWWMPIQDRQEEMGIEADENMPKYMVPANLIPFENLNDMDLTEEEVKRLKEEYGKQQDR